MFFIKNFHPPVHCCFLTVGQPGWCIIESTYLPPMSLAEFLPLCMFLSCSKGFYPVFLPSQKLTSSKLSQFDQDRGSSLNVMNNVKIFVTFRQFTLSGSLLRVLTVEPFPVRTVVTQSHYSCSSSKQPSSQNPVHFS